jgi:hypothetical protein
MEPAFIRKCKIKKFHNALRQFELVYTCGYARFVPIADMLEILNTHHLYYKSDNSKIRLSVQKAEEEWNVAHDPSLLTRLQKAVPMEHGQSVAATDARSTRYRKRSNPNTSTHCADPDKRNGAVVHTTALIEGAVKEQSVQEGSAVDTAIEVIHDDKEKLDKEGSVVDTAIEVIHDDKEKLDKEGSAVDTAIEVIHDEKEKHDK